MERFIILITVTGVQYIYIYLSVVFGAAMWHDLREIMIVPADTLMFPPLPLISSWIPSP